MKIKLLKPMLVAGEHGEKDKEFDVSEQDAYYCINRGYAVKVEEPAKAKAKK